MDSLSSFLLHSEIYSHLISEDTNQINVKERYITFTMCFIFIYSNTTEVNKLNKVLKLEICLKTLNTMKQKQ